MPHSVDATSPYPDCSFSRLRGACGAWQWIQEEWSLDESVLPPRTRRCAQAGRFQLRPESRFGVSEFCLPSTPRAQSARPAAGGIEKKAASGYLKPSYPIELLFSLRLP